MIEDDDAEEKEGSDTRALYLTGSKTKGEPSRESAKIVGEEG